MSLPSPDCPRCSADHFTWLPCNCLWQCNRVINCNGLTFKRRGGDNDS